LEGGTDVGKGTLREERYEAQQAGAESERKRYAGRGPNKWVGRLGVGYNFG
jgi:hypothetical protein